MIAAVHARGTAMLGEGPRMLGRDRAELYWVDLLAGTVLQRDLSGAAVEVCGFPGETASALIPLRNGRTAVALRRRLAVIDSEGAPPLFREFPEIGPGLRFSDAVAGPSGHLWLGVVRDEGSAGAGFLLRAGTDGVVVARVGIGFSNGIGFSGDGRRMFHVDSDAATVEVIEHDHRSGNLGLSSVLFRLPESVPGGLDGLAVDERDRVWVAVFGAGLVLGIDADGTVVERVEVPARRVSSCCFGGDGSLYITTARIDADAAELCDEPDAGSVFVCSAGCSGGPIWEGNPLE